MEVLGEKQVKSVLKYRLIKVENESYLSQVTSYRIEISKLGYLWWSDWEIYEIFSDEKSATELFKQL